MPNEKLKSILIDYATKGIKGTKNIEDIKNINLTETPETSMIEFLLQEKLVDFSVLKEILATHFSIQTKDLTEVSDTLSDIIPQAVALKHRAFAFPCTDNKIGLAMANPLNNQIIQDISLICGKSTVVFFAQPSQILSFIDRHYSRNITTTGSNTATDIVESVINSAILQKASDIHIEPNESGVIVRFRVNGILKRQPLVIGDIFTNVLSRLKIMANLDIAESRFPKDGSFKMDSHKDVDFRLSILPTIFGEKVALRLIYKHNLNFGLDAGTLGFFVEDAQIIKDMLRNPNGAILVTGPTGSGKTTTLASFLTYLNKEDINITTVEDPVENVMEGINHVTINPKIGLDFSVVLRHILRQDPDIIMIGEIRDTETAAIVIRAAITGHLVLSTLHTNNALSTIARLTDMGIEKHLLTEAIRGIISQRLLRRLCPHCKTPEPMPLWLIERGYSPQNLYKRVGCPKCFGTGFVDRFAIYEIVTMSDKLKKDIITGSWETPKTLAKRAMEHLLAGETSLEEVYSLIL
ncbi:MAG: GspE/PulE family protein [Defluviitaleaceae bacterium]|nr:GspE/PulE family protein [Defluviitaleaceae bacterium]